MFQPFFFVVVVLVEMVAFSFFFYSSPSRIIVYLCRASSSSSFFFFMTPDEARLSGVDVVRMAAPTPFYLQYTQKKKKKENRKKNIVERTGWGGGFCLDEKRTGECRSRWGEATRK